MHNYKNTLDPLIGFLTMRRHFRWNRAGLEAYRHRCLRRLIRHAYHNVAYYRRLLDRRGVKPESIRGVEDLALFPTTTKRDLQSLPEKDILSHGADPAKLMTFRTSGSSGEPLTIRRTTVEHLTLRAFYLRSMAAIGLRKLDSIAYMASLNKARARRQPIFWRLLKAIDPRRRVEIDVRQPLEDIVRKLEQFQPDVVIGYAGTLARLADMLAHGSEAAGSLRPPRLVKADSEVMTPQMRDRIHTGFGAPVYEMYDSHEFLTLAWECCETGELHVCDDGVILEVLKDGRPCGEGERGEVVVTGLHSYAMPLIRYRLGDIVTRGKQTCSCGLPFSTIRSIQGRMIDYFPLPDGRLLHPYEIVKKLSAHTDGWLGQYQLMQERTDRIVLSVMALSTPSTAGLTRLEADIRSIVGPDVDVRVRLVARIDTESSGKFRVSRSLVSSPYDNIQWDRIS